MFRRDFPLRINRLFGEELPAFPRPFQRAMDTLLQDVWEPSLSPWSAVFAPSIDVDEDERQVRVFAELPGLTENDVEIVYEPGSLILRGEKREEKREEERREPVKGRGRYEERRYGSFERRIPLRAEIQEDQIQASFERGVLTITLPKTPEARAQARRITIRGAAPSGQLEQSARPRGQAPAEGSQSAAH